MKPISASVSLVNEIDFLLTLTYPHLCHQVWVWFALTRLFWKSAPSDITSWRVHLDLCWIDEQRLIQSTGWAGRLIYPAHLWPTCDVIRGRSSKRLVRANHTHTWWYNMSPLTHEIKREFIFHESKWKEAGLQLFYYIWKVSMKKILSAVKEAKNSTFLTWKKP